MNEKLKQSILKTLCYFDIFNMPLAKEELYRWLWDYRIQLDFADFIKQLEHLEQLQQLSHLQHFGRKHGYYFLHGRESIVESRQLSIPTLEHKLKIAKRAAEKLRYIPFVKTMFVCNTVASSSSEEDSDIDVFIIVKRGRIWLARLFVTLTLSLFRMRRTKKKIKNKICLSFYATDDNLNLGNVAIEEPDIYLIYWIDQLIPIYDPENVRAEIIKQNQWIKKYIPNALQDYKMLSRYKAEDSKLSKIKKKFWEAMWKDSYGDLIESQAKAMQKRKMSWNYDSAKDEDNTKVIISDKMLKFHENDRREYYKEKWQERCQEVFQSVELN